MSTRWLSVAAPGSLPDTPVPTTGEDMVFDPIHYLPLLEHKIGALDQAAPASRMGTA